MVSNKVLTSTFNSFIALLNYMHSSFLDLIRRSDVFDVRSMGVFCVRSIGVLCFWSIVVFCVYVFGVRSIY